MRSLVGLIGYPLGHTISPAFQQAAFDYHSLPVDYHAWPTHPDLLEYKISSLRSEEYLGSNVTVPHKERVAGLVDRLDPAAEAIGAVNTIIREDNGLSGYNTDAYGFVTSLKEMGKFNPRGKRAVLLGAGGAARAAVFALAEEGVRSLTIANRTLERAETLAASLGSAIREIAAVPLGGPGLERAVSEADLIVNSTSVGMQGGDASSTSALRAELIPASALVYDMVYNPARTPLLEEAAEAGANCLGGLPMLVYQGAGAFERWTGLEAPVEVMFEAAEEALEQMRL